GPRTPPARRSRPGPGPGRAIAAASGPAPAADVGDPGRRTPGPLPRCATPEQPWPQLPGAGAALPGPARRTGDGAVAPLRRRSAGEAPGRRAGVPAGAA